MIKVVIFDLDDTLTSEKDFINSGFNKVCSVICDDYKLDFNYVRKLMDDLFLESSKNVFNRVLEKLDLKYDKDYILSLTNEYRNHTPNLKFFDDVEETLDYLKSKNIKLGIITDGYLISQRNKIKVLDMESKFDYIIITDELGKEYWKPHRKSYDMMRDRFNCNYDEMIYIGDNVNKDFVTANKLGIKTICIKRKNGIYSNLENKEKEYFASININSLKEVIDNI